MNQETVKEPFDRIGRLKELSEKFGWLDAYRKANRDKMVGDSRGIKRIEEHEILPFAPIDKVEKASEENRNMCQNIQMSNISENKSNFKKKLLKQAELQTSSSTNSDFSTWSSENPNLSFQDISLILPSSSPTESSFINTSLLQILQPHQNIIKQPEPPTQQPFKKKKTINLISIEYQTVKLDENYHEQNMFWITSVAKQLTKEQILREGGVIVENQQLFDFEGLRKRFEQFWESAEGM